MANRKEVSNAGIITYTITEDETINLGEAAEGVAGSWVIHITGAGSYSILPRKRIARGSLAAASAAPTWYYDELAGAAVAANTAITSASLVTVQANCSDVILSVDWTSGACKIECLPQLG